MSAPIAGSFEEAVAWVKSLQGRRPLCRDDLLILALAEISRTFTRDEVGYADTGETSRPTTGGRE